MEMKRAAAISFPLTLHAQFHFYDRRLGTNGYPPTFDIDSERYGIKRPRIVRHSGCILRNQQITLSYDGWSCIDEYAANDRFRRCIQPFSR